MFSNNFSRSEFKCKCGNCNFDTVDHELITVLEDARKHFGKAVKINSACRCAAHNKAVGGKSKSKHLYGIAADIAVKDTTPLQVYSYLANKYSDKYGLGSYNTFTHIDVRQTKARW